MKELREGVTLLLERIGTAAVSFDISIGHIYLGKRKKCWKISLTISRFFGRAHPNTNSGRIGGPCEAGYNISSNRCPLFLSFDSIFMSDSPIRVVITGMGVVSPIGCEIDSFWNSLQEGVSGITKLDCLQTTRTCRSSSAARSNHSKENIEDFGPLDKQLQRNIRKWQR